MNRSLESFLRDQYGVAVWDEVVRGSDLEITTFEPMLSYDDAVTDEVLRAACRTLCKPASLVLEDLGVYLVAHPNMWRIRRLLRFGGADFVEFLESLEDLPDRVKLAMPDFDMPRLFVTALPAGQFQLRATDAPPALAYLFLGAVRAMADDYGALAMTEVISNREEDPVLDVVLLSESFTKGRAFALTGHGA